MRIDTILSKNILNNFQNFGFQEVACPFGQTDILEILLARRHKLVAQNRWASVRYCVSVFISLPLITPYSMTLWSNLAACSHSLKNYELHTTPGNFPSN